jgi:glucose-1-phosphate cytidylyltransferase
MKVVLLAGGLGTRLTEETKKIPKPMVKIGKLPILIHIMKIYSFYGHKDFIICAGYKYQEIVKFFKNFLDFKLCKKVNNNFFFISKKNKWRVTIVFTGKSTNTGGRLLRVKKLLKNDTTFFLTYGDGLSDININKLLKLHNKKKKISTISAVSPPGRFGVLNIKNYTVTKFQEKVENANVWINGGFFVFNNNIFKYINSNSDSLEQNVITKIVKVNEMTAYKHHNFWLPMDTLRDKIKLNELWKKNKAPWKLN